MMTNELLDIALRKEPGLTPFGLGKPGGGDWALSANLDWDEDAVLTCYEFCRGIEKTKTAPGPSSYGWKHVVEDSCGRYIPNGAFIAGALAAGFEIQSRSGPNATFNLSRKSLRAVIPGRRRVRRWGRA